MSERSHHHNPAAHPLSRPTSARGKAPSLTHQPDPPASPTISFSSVPRPRWVPNCGMQTADPLSSKRGTDESGAFHREPLTMHAVCPRKDIACVLLAQTKTQQSCFIGCQITRTRIHTLLERLASARHDNKENCIPTRMHASNRPISENEKEDDVFSQQPFIVVAPVVTSWAVAGQQVVFLHMYLQTRVMLRAFPIATPRGCSSKFP